MTRAAWRLVTGGSGRRALVVCVLLFSPALLALWAGGAPWLVVLNVLVLLAIVAVLAVERLGRPRAAPAASGLFGAPLSDQPAPPLSRGELNARLLDDAAAAGLQGPRPAALVLRLDDAERLQSLYGAARLEAVMQEMTVRLGSALRRRDAFCLLPPDGFAVALTGQMSMDVETVTAIARRLQHQLTTQPGGDALHGLISLSAGLCIDAAAARRQGLDMMEAAAMAAERARQIAPGTILSFNAMDLPALVAREDHKTLRTALDDGSICAHFQPQIAAATGHVSGMEALARWHCPYKGLLSPAVFLPRIAEAGLGQRLAQRMLDDSLDLLVSLDKAGLHVPNVAVNLSQEDLRNPRLADQTAWALDARDLQPERLVVEVLEEVIAENTEDLAVQTVARLAGMGCGVDLDDFGTGHASIASIRHFAVGRLKIDRSFVRDLHKDHQQTKIVSAILSMARELDLDTLAEGVECDDETNLLTQMGCGHLQGFAIARPMPAAAISDWLLANPHRLGTPVVGAPPGRQAATAGPLRQ